jgi:hypothetical protein
LLRYFYPGTSHPKNLKTLTEPPIICRSFIRLHSFLHSLSLFVSFSRNLTLVSMTGSDDLLFGTHVLFSVPSFP